MGMRPVDYIVQFHVHTTYTQLWDWSSVECCLLVSWCPGQNYQHKHYYKLLDQEEFHYEM